MRVRVHGADDLGLGQKRQVHVGGKAVVICRTSSDEYFALRDVCPHQGAELSKGVLSGTCSPAGVGDYVYERSPEILRCPWHGWEFDVRTGENVYMPHSRYRVKTYPVEVSRDGIFVEI